MSYHYAVHWTLIQHCMSTIPEKGIKKKVTLIYPSSQKMVLNFISDQENSGEGYNGMHLLPPEWLHWERQKTPSAAENAKQLTLWKKQ